MIMRHFGDGGCAHGVWMAETFLFQPFLIAAVVLVARHLGSRVGASASLGLRHRPADRMTKFPAVGL